MNTAKRVRVQQAKQDTIEANWSKIDLTKMCWMTPDVPPFFNEFASFTPEFTTHLTRVNTLKLIDIFKHFMTEELLLLMIKEMDPLCLVFQSRKVNKNFILNLRKVLQAMAVEARITARPLSQNSQFGKLKNCIDESRNYFKRMIGPRDKKEWPICYNQISRILSSCLILPVHYPTLF